MNELTLTQLKTLVERVVRPVQASIARKRRMRDELLAHVIATFEQELAKLDNESAALEQTAVRLGDPSTLTNELQESISIGDRIRSFVDTIWSRPGESWLFRAVRQGVLIDLLTVVFLLTPWLAAGAPLRHLSIDAFRLVEPVLLALFLIAFAYPFLAEWMFRAIYGFRGRSPRKIALLTLTCGVIFVGLGVWMDGWNPISLALAAA
jgi:ATP-dependent Clp protease ATP-binding subunit ClpC